ncbi:hypothetical protein COX95_01550 [bacterium CG_4_10_14_0_2_um_filter_33_32]|nr:MAG: hypothetical protein AUJ93_03880 [bacterium CG2_30_33_46]PIU76527.1 MAG: hypothetical protein COS74_03570 [bacterium CG06_land_8_20_14_3_00_33_50]PIW81211.1 MAG: hypothetical protein COZ97_02965 [bacterium CG_4_8_14_3_um_filter_33_28]PIY85579.1 MAG: hypothetical protein COY76_01425 [bacterium CG_4_10_14_0_8_um_filter_33_57]PIZ86358.1 MAG: hypothetical protein COX95_01550 [bacterium CG_4_10_14_0_2_um_filter_33_32]PJA72613.1 MAG: hypothetical protein CO152_00515 [bacterium CG_4_9_14_3_um
MNLKDFYAVKLIKYVYRRFFEKNPLILFFIFAVIFNLITWGIASIKGRPENYLIPLHYLPIKGIDKTGPWYYIYGIPLSGTIILIINSLIIFMMSKRNLINVSYLLASATIFIEMFFIIAINFLVFKVQI